jgi:hypothetical protein
MTTLQRNIIENNIKHFGFDNILNFATNQAKLLTMSKIEEYENIIKFFENKYKMKYKEFNKVINKINNSEDFEKEDDLMEWRFAEDCIKLYKKELNALNKC